MKKIILCIVLLLVSAFVFANVINGETLCPGGICTEQQIGAQSDATSLIGIGGIIVDPASGYDRFPNIANGEVATFNIFLNKQGKAIAYVLNDDDYSENSNFLLNVMNVDNKLIKRQKDFTTVNLPKSSIENSSLSNEWENYYKNLANGFAKITNKKDYIINQNNAGYKLGVALGLYTGNATTDRNNILKGQTTEYEVITAAIIVINKQKQLITSYTAGSVCSRYIGKYGTNASGQMGAYCRAIRDTNGVFSDNGYIKCASCEERKKAENPNATNEEIDWLCCLEENNNKESACKGYRIDGDDDDDDDDDDNPNTCTQPVTKTHEVKNGKMRKENIETTPSCNGTYSYTEYNYFTKPETGKVIYETTTTITVNLNGILNKQYYAGTSFDWEDASAIKTTVTKIFDTAPLDNQVNFLKTSIENAEAQIKYYDCLIKANSDTIEASTKNITELTKRLYNFGQCPVSNKEKCEESQQNAKNKITNQINSLTQKNTSLGEENKKYESAIGFQNGLIKNYQTNLKELETYRENLNNIGDITPVVEAVDVNNIEEYMQLTLPSGSTTKYERDQIKGATINGELMFDECSGDDCPLYTKIDSNYYIPIDISNGTNGRIYRTIAIEGKQISYDCPLGTTNNLNCSYGDCDLPIVGTTNIIFRPISLSNPFPNVKSGAEYRTMGANWNEELADTYIKNNRGTSDYNVYTLKPMYTITLTPSTIKEIREYNNNHNYNDSSFDCSNDTCVSNFLWKDFNNIINTENSCASDAGIEGC